jgi:hypothetical protein
MDTTMQIKGLFPLGKIAATPGVLAMELNNVTTGAFLVRLQISKWSPRKLDRTASKEARDRAGASAKASVKVYKTVLAADELDRITSIEGVARDEHEKRTVPWQYKGPGAITAGGYPTYKNKMAELKTEYMAAVDTFCAVYEREREEARTYLGDKLFNPADYPPLSEIRARFAFAVIVEPMPQSQDFRIQGLDSNDTHAIKGDMDKRFKATIEAAQANAWDRLLDHIEKLKAKVETYKPAKHKGDKTEGTFRDTLVTNLKEMVDLLPSLNITNDPALNQIGARVKASLLQHSAETLRESETIRAQVVESAEDVLQHVQQIWATRTAGKAA